MYKNLEIRNENFKKLERIAEIIFNNFIENTQETFEKGSLYLKSVVEYPGSFSELSYSEIENFKETTLKTITKILNERFEKNIFFESAEIDDRFLFSEGEIKKLVFKIEVMLKR